MAGLDAVLETTTAERPATGFVFTEGPLWHPDGFYYFADVRSSMFYRLRLGQAPETVRTNTGEGNGTTLDLQGRLVICEGGNRRVTRWSDDTHSEVLMDRYEGKRINRPNDVVCKSDGSIWFTDPGLRVPLADKELPHSGVYAVAPNGAGRLVAEFEYPNGLAFSPMSACFTSPIRVTLNTSTRSISTAPATWSSGGSSPICLQTRPTAFPTA